jgi:GNAT superfamily N-acetyltransferase
MITRVVGPTHEIARGDLSDDADEFFSDGVLPEGGADGAILAREAGKTIGWLRFYFDRRSRVFTASGTWVEPDQRDKGVAERLWNRAMCELKPVRVVVTTVTREGRHLVGSIVRWFPEVEFDVR